MTVGEIIKQVKWCIDHETTGYSKLEDNGEDTYMDNIIKAKINDALHWVAMTASQSTKAGESKTAIPGGGTTTEMVASLFSEVNGVSDVGVVTMPSEMEIIEVSRVRGYGWHKGVAPIEDTSDDALMMFDETAKGSADRPQAAIMRTTPMEILVQPYTLGGTVTVTYVGVPKNVNTSSDSTDVNVPEKLRTAFVYYIAYLLLTAYADGNAQLSAAVVHPPP